MQKYSPPSLEMMGSLARLTAADFTSSATDSYIDSDGTDLNDDGALGLTGSGPGCVDSDQNGVCDYLEP